MKKAGLLLDYAILKAETDSRRKDVCGGSGRCKNWLEAGTLVFGS